MAIAPFKLHLGFVIGLALSQVAAVVGYALMLEDPPLTTKKALEITVPTEAEALNRLFAYPFFLFVNLMVSLGFGLLLTFIHRHRVTTLVTCLWVGSLAIQFYFFWIAVWELVFVGEKYSITLDKLVFGEFASASVLVAVCAIIGKASNLQYFLLTMLFMPAYALNEHLVLLTIGTRDVGGSMVIHTFGALFGLIVAWFLKYPNGDNTNKNLHPSQGSFTTALAGTTVLWALWPAFNGAVAGAPLLIGLAVGNTYISLFCSVIGTIFMSTIFFKGKFNIDHLANATLAGGVIMGSCADLIKWAWVSELVGLFGGVVSTILFNYMPALLVKIGLHDVAGIFNLHFIPGVLGGLLSIIFRGVWVKEGAQKQIFGLLISIGISLGAGLLTGIVIRFFNIADKPNDFYNDYTFVEMEDHMASKLSHYGHSYGGSHAGSQGEPEGRGLEIQTNTFKVSASHNYALQVPMSTANEIPTERGIGIHTTENERLVGHGSNKLTRHEE